MSMNVQLGGKAWDTYGARKHQVASHAGENIAAAQTTAAEANLGWREDDEPYAGQGHRRNMLSSEL